jgi:hypothetical protein
MRSRGASLKPFDRAAFRGDLGSVGMKGVSFSGASRRFERPAGRRTKGWVKKKKTEI